eukprot:284026_1
MNPEYYKYFGDELTTEVAKRNGNLNSNNSLEIIDLANKPLQSNQLQNIVTDYSDDSDDKQFYELVDLMPHCNYKYCRERCGTNRQCKKCNQVNYCSKSHKKADREDHKKQCKKYKKQKKLSENTNTNNENKNDTEISNNNELENESPQINIPVATIIDDDYNQQRENYDIPMLEEDSQKQEVDNITMPDHSIGNSRKRKLVASHDSNEDDDVCNNVQANVKRRKLNSNVSVLTNDNRIYDNNDEDLSLSDNAMNFECVEKENIEKENASKKELKEKKRELKETIEAKYKNEIGVTIKDKKAVFYLKKRGKGKTFDYYCWAVQAIGSKKRKDLSKYRRIVDDKLIICKYESCRTECRGTDKKKTMGKWQYHYRSAH